MDRKILGIKLKVAREERKYTQKELCEFLNISQQTLSDYEQGKISIPLDNLEKIKNKLKKDFNYFLE